MGCVGEGLSCREQQVSICAKDSSGPYDYEMTGELIALAKSNGIDYAVDVYLSLIHISVGGNWGHCGLHFACHSHPVSVCKAAQPLAA